MLLRQGRLNITIDGQFGSTGKGVLNSYVASQGGLRPDICVSNAAPNAGHTFVDAAGARRTCFHLPVSGVLLPRSMMYLCAGSIIDPALLAREMADFGVAPARLVVDPRACILLPEHAAREGDAASGATRVASTRKGVGAALADKVARLPGPRTAGQYFAQGAAGGLEGLRVERLDLAREMDAGKTVLMEVPQGYGLSINHGLSYPQCTSRDITIAAALNDAGLHPHYLGSVTVALRSYPIRVGHIVEDGVEIGNSGPFWPDSTECSWEELGQPPELTTVTKRVRRVATFSFLQYEDILRHLRPDAVFVNFLNYLQSEQALAALAQGMTAAEEKAGLRPRRLGGLGPAAADVIDMDDLNAVWRAIEARRAAG